MKKARLKRLHIQDDFISWHSRKGKLSGQKIEQASPGASDEEEADSQKGLWGDGDENVLYLIVYPPHPSAPAERSHPLGSLP